MFEHIIEDKTFEFNCKLGTTIKIKSKFNKPFMSVIQEIDKLDTTQLIDLLYCGINKDEVKYDEFKNHLLDNIGLMDLYEIVQKFVKKIQYPTLSFEDIDEKLKEKNLQTETGE